MVGYNLVLHPEIISYFDQQDLDLLPLGLTDIYHDLEYVTPLLEAIRVNYNILPSILLFIDQCTLNPSSINALVYLLNLRSLMRLIHGNAFINFSMGQLASYLSTSVSLVLDFAIDHPL